MGKKEKTKKKKSISLRPFSAEEEIRLKELLKDPGTITPANIRDRIPDPDLARALLERLPTHDPEILGVILAIKETFPRKDVQKTVRKVFFKLRQNKILPPDLEVREKTPALPFKPEKVEPIAYLGPTDGNGTRGVFTALPHLPQGFDVGMGVASDEMGIMQFFNARTGKKKMKEIKEFFFSHFHPMVETTVAHAATVLERAYRAKPQEINQESRNYLEWRARILKNTALLERPAIYDHLSPEGPEIVDTTNVTDSQMDRLLGHELMQTWTLDLEKIKPLLEEIKKTEESPILLMDAQQLDRKKELKRNALTQIYPEESRPALKWNLEEMAYVFLKLGEEAVARIALTCALSLEKKDSIFEVNPFLEALLERSMNYYSALAKEGPQEVMDKGSTPMIIRP
ncbi:MAG: hypothetical protein ABIG67_03810 [Pseudomonadota bacterium]